MSFHGNLLDGLGGAVIAGGFSAFGASKQNEAARDRAIEAMKFSARMSRTAYQRSMADMRAAGLNPILAYQRGGATSPSGVTAQTVNEMEGAVTSAMGARRQNAELKQASKVLERTDNETLNLKKQNELYEAQKTQAWSQRQLNMTTAKKVNAEAALANSKVRNAQTEAAYRQEFLQSSSGKAAYRIQQFGAAAGAAGTAFGALRHLGPVGRGIRKLFRRK